ncbi:MAG TPA: TssN family type VI secretion system protein [Panacibacter sp.]|nr:TssN family type VI secretion system protein [Panacibacter sp.]
MLVYIIISAIIFLGSTILFFVKNRRNVDSKKRKVVLFLLISGIIITLLGLFGLIPSITDTVLWFILLQTIFLGLGILYYYMLRRNFFGDFEAPHISNTALTLANAALGFIGFTFLFDYFTQQDVAHLYASGILLFTVPYLFMSAFHLLAAIPPEIHKVWYYPLGSEEPDFDKVDLNNIFLMELEFSKSPEDNVVKNYKAKAPIDLLFGEWYRSFIDNYNYKFDEAQIQYMNKQNMPHGWMFFTKPTFWKAKMYIDPDASIKQNKLTEKMIIVAKRVEED